MWAHYMPCVTVQQKQEFPNVKGLHSDTESSESFPLHGRIFLLVTSGRQQSQTGLNDRKLRKKKKEGEEEEEEAGAGEDNHDEEVEEEKGRPHEISFNKSHKLSCVLGMRGGKCPHNSAAVPHSARRPGPAHRRCFAH